MQKWHLKYQWIILFHLVTWLQEEESWRAHPMFITWTSHIADTIFIRYVKLYPISQLLKLYLAWWIPWPLQYVSYVICLETNMICRVHTQAQHAAYIVYCTRNISIHAWPHACLQRTHTYITTTHFYHDASCQLALVPLLLLHTNPTLWTVSLLQAYTCHVPNQESPVLYLYFFSWHLCEIRP